MVLGSFIQRGLGFMLALVLAITALSCVMPCPAAATDDELGSVDSPAVDNAGEQQTVNGVTVSAEGDSALIEGCSFGINDFYRAQAGSNKAVGDRYWGYNYYIGTQPDNLSVISTGDYAVVYIPRATQEAFGFLYDNHNDQDYIKRYFTALDDANAKGSSRLSNVSKWYFTEQQSFEVNGVVFNFDQELDEGRYYAYIIGSDGSDVTSKASSNQVRLDFADFARAVPPSDVQIVQASTGIAWLANFLATMDYSPLWVTLRTTLIAIVFIFILGLAPPTSRCASRRALSPFSTRSSPSPWCCHPRSVASCCSLPSVVPRPWASGSSTWDSPSSSAGRQRSSQQSS